MARKVLLALKVMPESVDTNLEALKQEIRYSLEDIAELKDIKEESIAFGLKALKVLVMVNDEQGISDKVEEVVSKIEGVENAEVESVTLI